MKPSIGRIVWCCPQGSEAIKPAVITAVHSDTCINVVFFDCQKSPAANALTSLVLCEAKDLKPGMSWARPPKV